MGTSRESQVRGAVADGYLRWPGGPGTLAAELTLTVTSLAPVQHVLLSSIISPLPTSPS